MFHLLVAMNEMTDIFEPSNQIEDLKCYNSNQKNRVKDHVSYEKKFKQYRPHI